MADDRKIIRFAATSLFAAAGTIIIGFIIFQSAIFQMNNNAFQFVAFGIVGGIIFSTFRFLSRFQATAAMLLLFVLDMALERSTTWKFILPDVLYYFGFTIAIFFFAYYYFDKLHGVIIGRVLMLSSIAALSYVVITIILYLVFLVTSNEFGLNLLQMIYFNLSQGFLIGFGLGAGIEAGEWFGSKKGKE